MLNYYNFVTTVKLSQIVSNLVSAATASNTSFYFHSIYGPGLSVSKIPLWTKVSTTDNKWQTVKVPIHTKMQIFERSKPDINVKNYYLI